MRFKVYTDEPSGMYFLEIRPENEAESSQIKDLKEKITPCDLTNSTDLIRLCIEKPEDENHEDED